VSGEGITRGTKLARLFSLGIPRHTLLTKVELIYAYKDITERLQRIVDNGRMMIEYNGLFRSKDQSNLLIL
jgi:hypothetical protein